MTCEDVRDLLPLLHYGELTEPESGIAREHLRDCPGCRRELEQIGNILLAAGARQAPSLPEEFWIRNAAETIERIRNVSGPRLTARKTLLHRVLPWVCAAAAVVLVLGIVALKQSRTPGETTTAAQSNTDLSELETALSMVCLHAEAGILACCSSEPANGFDSGMGSALGSVEGLVDDLLVELESPG